MIYELKSQRRYLRNTAYTWSDTPRLHNRASIKPAWWNSAAWLKCRPKLSPQLITCYIGLPVTTRPPS